MHLQSTICGAAQSDLVAQIIADLTAHISSAKLTVRYEVCEQSMLIPDEGVRVPTGNKSIWIELDGGSREMDVMIDPESCCGKMRRLKS